jgi:hypothetical protein
MRFQQERNGPLLSHFSTFEQIPQGLQLRLGRRLKGQALDELFSPC